MDWGPLLRTRAEGWTILVRLMVGLVVFFPEGIQKLVFPEILGAGRFTNIGIPYPEVMGPFVGTVEIVCGALIILGFEVGYELFGINGRMLGHGEPIRVKAGERVLFHVLNASATEIRSLALPGHVFRIVALDGNPVPTQTDVLVLWLGTAERVSALVEMKHPGVWVMGDLADDDRKHGMGIVVEYAGQKGKPQWVKPKPFHWDYTQFGKANEVPPAPDETIEITIVKHNGVLDGFNQWTLNGEAFSMETKKPMYMVHQGRRYRLKFRNASDDIHPLHLHRHSFELMRIGGKPTAGVIKDVVMLGGFQELEFDFVADNPGPTLFHCHQQLSFPLAASARH